MIKINSGFFLQSICQLTPKFNLMKKNDFPFNAITGYAWKIIQTLCIIPHIWKNDILETHDMKTHE